MNFTATRPVSPTMNALLQRFDVVQQACARGRIARRDSGIAFRDAKVDHDRAFAEARLEALRGPSRTTADERRDRATLDTMDSLTALETARELRSHTTTALRSLEAEWETLQALAHTFNRELKLEAGKLEAGLDPPGQPEPPKRKKAQIPGILESTPGFTDAWAGWLLWRKTQKRHSVTASGARQSLSILAENPGTAVATIEQSIRNDWQGLFPDNKGSKKKPLAMVGEVEDGGDW